MADGKLKCCIHLDIHQIVNAKSNSEFFESLQYELEYNKEITESDIAIEWTTLKGKSKAMEHDQLAIASD